MKARPYSARQLTDACHKAVTGVVEYVGSECDHSNAECVTQITTTDTAAHVTARCHSTTSRNAQGEMLETPISEGEMRPE